MSGDIARQVYRSVIDRLPDYAAVNLMYFASFRRLPNLRYPRTFTEKIAWRKLYQPNPLFTVFSDKIAVKAEISKLIGAQHVIETLWVGSRPEAIPFESLEPPYVIKANHNSGGTFFIRTARDIRREEIVASLRAQLATAHGHRFREWGYYGVSPQVLVERMIAMPDGAVPEDYKFFTYHGRVHYLHYDIDRFTHHKRNLYDREWNLLPVKFKCPTIPDPVPRPANLDEMIDLAEKIGALFDFVRVDFYSPPQGILFGEVAFYPNAGLQAFVPNEWDNKFGEPWQV